jgi:hypothetical protein
MEPVEVVKQCYEAFARGDIPGVLSRVSPDVSWIDPGFPDVPYAGVREDVARDVDLRFEIRLTGEGGGAWTVHVHDGTCEVIAGFTADADVRYTADARIWCGVALGLIDAREVHAKGKFLKEGGPEAMDRFFHQVSRPRRQEATDSTPPDKE